MEYIGKATRDAGGVITAIDSLRPKPIGYIPSRYVAVEGIKTQYPMTELNNGKWRVIEDSSRKTSEETTRTQLMAAKNFIQNFDSSTIVDIATTRTALRRIVRVLAVLARNIK